MSEAGKAEMERYPLADAIPQEQLDAEVAYLESLKGKPFFSIPPSACFCLTSTREESPKYCRINSLTLRPSQSGGTEYAIDRLISPVLQGNGPSLLKRMCPR